MTAHQTVHVLYELTNTESKYNDVFKQNNLEHCKIQKAQ